MRKKSSKAGPSICENWTPQIPMLNYSSLVLRYCVMTNDTMIMMGVLTKVSANYSNRAQAILGRQLLTR